MLPAAVLALPMILAEPAGRANHGEGDGDPDGTHMERAPAAGEFLILNFSGTPAACGALGWMV